VYELDVSDPTPAYRFFSGGGKIRRRRIDRYRARNPMFQQLERQSTDS
jgi:hypothetical protein